MAAPPPAGFSGNHHLHRRDGTSACSDTSMCFLLRRQRPIYRSLSAMDGLRRRPAAVCSSRRSAARRGAGRQPDSTAACMQARYSN
uniref:Uncharacterized protein n=1 Tax=Oryza meridionalis TaxID=40149 RepID=A0A0E0E796_9ORYZ